MKVGDLLILIEPFVHSKGTDHELLLQVGDVLRVIGFSKESGVPNLQGLDNSMYLNDKLFIDRIKYYIVESTKISNYILVTRSEVSVYVDSNESEFIDYYQKVTEIYSSYEYILDVVNILNEFRTYISEFKYSKDKALEFFSYSKKELLNNILPENYSNVENYRVYEGTKIL